MRLSAAGTPAGGSDLQLAKDTFFAGKINNIGELSRIIWRMTTAVCEKPELPRCFA